MLALSSFDERIVKCVNEIMSNSMFSFDKTDLSHATRAFVNRLFMSNRYKPSVNGLRLNQLLLIKCGQTTNSIQNNLEEDYGLSSVYNGKIRIEIADGDHRSFLESANGQKVATLLNEYLTLFQE